MPHPVTGDTAVSTTYSGWRDWGGGVKFPARIVQAMGGAPVLDITVTEVEVNGAFASDVPAPLIESPLYDGRAQAVLAEVRRLVPAKPLRYVVNSHHHFDHSGGLRAAAATGATLVVSEPARPWFERTLANANAIRPDVLQQSGRRATVTGVDGRRTFSDATRTVDIHFIEGSPHAQGFMMAWLPRERLLVEADAYTPGAPNQPPPATPNALHVNLVTNVQRLNMEVDRILPLHGRVVPFSDLRIAAKM